MNSLVALVAHLTAATNKKTVDCSVEKRLLANSETHPCGCVLWKLKPNKDGFGLIKIGGRSGKQHLVHRVAYEVFHGPLPNDMDVKHRCKNKLCIKKSHLYSAGRAQRGPRGHYIKSDN